MRTNEIVLSKKEIDEGIDKIQHALLLINLRCEPGDIGYETVYTDEYGETQGGWYAEFDKKSRDKLRESKQVSWRNTGMIGGDTLEDILNVIASLKFRNCTKEPTVLQLKMAQNIKNEVEATKQALENYNSTKPLSDEDLRLCLKHFTALDKAVQADPMLALCKLHVSLNLETLKGYKEARKRK